MNSQTENGAQTPAAALSRVCMFPPGQDDERCFRELVEHPEQWVETRQRIDTIGYADHVLNRRFSDDELRAWLPMLGEWGLKLELEVGAVKPWGPTGKKAFEAQAPTWDRMRRLGGRIHAIALGEPLCCSRKELSKPDQYVIESWVGAPSRSIPETADFTFTRSVRDFCDRFVRGPG